MALRDVTNNIKKKTKEAEEKARQAAAKSGVTKSSGSQNKAATGAKKAAQTAAKKVTYYSNRSKTGARSVGQNAAKKAAASKSVQNAAKNLPKKEQYAYSRKKQGEALSVINKMNLPDPRMIGDYGKWDRPKGLDMRTPMDQVGRSLYLAQDPTALMGLKDRMTLLSPMDTLYADKLAGRKYWRSRTPEISMSDRDQAMRIVKNSQRAVQNRRAAKQELSDWDRKNLNGGEGFQVQQAKQRYMAAAKAGRMDEAEKAHREAEMLRGLHGYSGGAAGNEYITPDVPQDVYNRLNSQGVTAWKQAQMQRQRAVTEDEIAKADQRIREVLNAKGYQKGPQTDADTARGWDFGPEGRRMWAGTREQNEKDAAQGKAALQATGEGIVGGLAYGMQIYNQANQDRYDESNMERWIRDAADYVSAENDLEYYDNFVKQFGRAPDDMPNRNVLVMRLNNAIQAKAQLERIRGDVDSPYFDPALAEYYGLPTTRDETLGERMLRQAAEHQTEATEGMSGAEKFFTNAMISTGQSLPGMALGAIPGVGTTLGLGLMGVQAGGSRAYQLKQQGLTTDEAFLGGLVSGGIEVLTERLPLENFAKIVNGKSGRTALKNILRQAGLEGTEEAVSYVGNYIADEALKHPDAQFSWLELLENAGMGAVAGAAFGTAGSMISEGSRRSSARQVEDIQEESAGQAQAVSQAQDIQADQRTEEARRLLEDAQSYQEMAKAGAYSEGEKALVKAALEERYAALAGAEAAPRTLEEAARQRTVDVQPELPPIQWERSKFPPSSLVGSLIDAARENNARNRAAEQLRADQAAFQAQQEERKAENRTAPAQAETQTAVRMETPRTVQTQTAARTQAQPSVQAAQPAQTQNVGAARSMVQPAQARDILMRRSQAFGENGRKAIMAAYRGTEDLGAYRKAFAQVYDQALSGKTQEQIRQPQALSGPQFYAAVQSGMKDRGISISMGVGATANRNAGLVLDSYSQNLDRETFRVIDGLAKAGGASIEFVDASMLDNPKAQGQIDGNRILIRKNAPDPVAFVAGHEITHRIKDVSPAEYLDYRDYVITKAALPGSVDAKIAEYARHGVTLSREAAMDEIAADYAGNLLRDSKELQKFVRDNYSNRTLIERILDVFRELAAKLTGRDKVQADEAVRLLEDALGAASEAVKTMGMADSAAAIMGVDQATTTAEAEDYGRYSLVTDEETLDFLDDQEHVTVYRAMQVIDGKLYPPMAAKVKSDDGKKTLVEAQEIGEWYQSDEKPELIPKKKTVKDKKTGEMREQGYFILDKGDGSTPLNVAYNPYFHTSASPLNDQFSSAHKRPNLVTVECEIPVSELSSGYRAEFAKDTVGETKWHAGPVASKLKGAKARRVFLSRWAKVNRIVPDAEVAQVIAKTLEGEDVAVPQNVVTPSLYAELKKQGVKTVDMEGNSTRYSLTPYSTDQIAKWGKSKKIVIYESQNQLFQFVQDALKDGQMVKKMYFGMVDPMLANDIRIATGLDVEGRNVTLRADNVRKIMRKHEKRKKRVRPNERELFKSDFLYIPDIIANPDEIRLSDEPYEGKPTIEFEKKKGNHTITIVAVDSGGSLDLFVQTMYAGKKSGSIFNVTDANAPIPTPETSAGTTPKNNVPQSEGESKKVSPKDDTQAVGDVGVEIDEETESAGPMRFSFKSWNESDYVEDRDAAAKVLAKQLKISQKKAKDFIDSVNSVAKMIADNRARLDYISSPGRSAFVSNAEYGGSIDFSTICKKRRLYTGTIEAIQRAMPNKALTADEMLTIRRMMKDKGYEVACGLCYVEGSRVKIGRYTQQFLDELKQSGAEYVPTLAEMNTTEGQETIRAEHPEVYAQYEKFMNKLAQRKPKLFQMATEYKGEILDKFQGKKDTVKEKNDNGGLRLQSFSDFEIIHLIDCMQVIMDMSRVGLAGQAYTKVPDFAWALGDTGLKINLSLIAKGVDENGKLILDEVEGMAEADAMALRDRYSDNVGTIIVTFDDAQLKAAMADDRIDFIIPFHRSQWNKRQYPMMGLPATTKDYTSKQNESYIKPVYGRKKDGSPKRLRAENFMPNTYWDFRKSGKQNAEKYLRMCAEANKKPKFFNLLVNNGDGSYSLQPDGSTDGYWKLLIDFKMYNNEGNGVPQKPVRPDFNMKEAERMLRDYTGGHESFPVAQDVVDEFVGGRQSEEGTRFSISVEKINPAEISPLNGITDKGKHDYLAKDFAENGWNGRPIVVIDMGNSYAAVTGSHRIFAAQKAGIDTQAVVIDANDDVLRLLNANGDEGRAAVAKELADDGLLPRDIADLIIREDDLNYENWGVDYQEQKRFSIGTGGFDQAKLMRENEKLRDRVEYWKGQTKKSDRTKVDPKEVRKLAKKLAGDFSTTMDTAEISGQLQTIYDGLGKDWSYDQAYEAAHSLAMEMVEQASESDGFLYNEYEPLRRFFRETPLVISPEIKRGITDYNDWRKAQMGRLVLKNGDRSNVDQVYQELSQLWPEWFDEERDVSSLDQLERIAEVMDGIYTQEETNPFQDDLEGPAGYLTAEIMDSFWDLPNVKKTWADRAEARLGREVARRLDMQEKYQEKLQQVRENRDAKLQAQKEKYLGREKARSQRQKERERRAQIMRHARDLSRKLLKPSDKQHIPQQLREAVAAVLDSVNLASKNHKETNRTKAFQELRLAYQDVLQQGESLVIDPDLMDNISEVEAMRDTPIAEMTLSQLETIWKTIRAVEASITTANKAFGQQRFATIFEAADGLRQAMAGRKDRGDYRGPVGAFDKLLNSGMLTSESYFHRMGETGQDIFRMLRNAQDKHIGIMQEAQDYTEKVVGKTKVRKWEKEVHTFDFDGEKVQLTTAQIMSLYELAKRKQAIDHITVGGIKPEGIDRGVKKNAPSEPYRLTIDQISEIVDSLTDEQMAMADALQRYMGGRLAQLGNEASMAVYGYEKFNEKNYFPIKVDKNQTITDQTKEAQAATIAGRGFTKSTTPKANNALIVRNIFDVYADHVTDMATYSSWLEAMENLQRIYNFTFRDEDNNRTGTVKGYLERTFGKNGLGYWEKLTEDLNNGVHGTNDNPFNSLIGNYKASAIGANIRVFIQQPTAILRALDQISLADFLAGLGRARPTTWAKVKKYAPIAVWKDWGYFDADTGRQMKSILFGDDSALAKVNNGLMAPAGMMDSLGWSHIWNALEAETRRTRKDLKPRTEAFYQAVAERFNEVIDHSQVVDGILQRSQVMRSPDALTKMATSFMAEPTKVYNMFTTAVYDLKHSQDPKARTQAMKVLGRTAFGLIASFFANAAAQSLVDALRDDDKDEEYWEKFFQAFYGLEGDEETAGEKIKNGILEGNLGAAFNPATYIPWMKDVVSLAQGFKVSRMDMDSISKFVQEIGSTWKAFHGDGKITLRNALTRLTAEGARLLGIPASNIKRDVLAVYSTVMNSQHNYLGQFELQKWLYRMDNTNNQTDFVKIAYAAQQAGDTVAYEKIKAELVDVLGQEKFDEKMKNLGKKELEAGGDHAEEFNRVYGTYETQMAGNPLYSEMPAEEKAKVEASLKQYASDQVMYDASSGEITSNDTEMAAIKEAEAAGIDPVTYKSFRVYYNGLASDKDENGKDIPGQTKQDKTIRAIEDLELPADQSSYLFHTVYESDANNPWA